MASTPSVVLLVGDINEVGFVFRAKPIVGQTVGALTTPTAVDIVIKLDGVVAETITETDSRVTLGPTTLSSTLGATLGLTDAEITAGTGVVLLEHIPASKAFWHFKCDSTAPIKASATSSARSYDA